MKNSAKTTQTGKSPTAMPDWNAIKGHWSDFEREIQERWHDLTADDLKMVAGDRDKLIGRIEERYHINRAAAEKQVSEWRPKLEGAAKKVTDSFSPGRHKA
ncbi:MAG TPA: hypothetical protein PLT07_04420 [Trueperaceae bacterium]|nr:hypothetical protein [Trueperaceae bacterium]